MKFKARTKLALGDVKSREVLAGEKRGRRAQIKRKEGEELWPSGLCDAVWPILCSSDCNAVD